MPKTFYQSFKPRAPLITINDGEIIHGTYINNSPKKPERFKNEYINGGDTFSEIRKREIDYNMRARSSAREQLHNYRNSVDKMISFSFISKILSINV